MAGKAARVSDLGEEAFDGEIDCERGAWRGGA